MSHQSWAFAVSGAFHAVVLLAAIAFGGATERQGSPRVIDLRFLGTSFGADAALVNRTPGPKMQPKRQRIAPPPAEPRPLPPPSSDKPPPAAPLLRSEEIAAVQAISTAAATEVNQLQPVDAPDESMSSPAPAVIQKAAGMPPQPGTEAGAPTEQTVPVVALTASGDAAGDSRGHSARDVTPRDLVALREIVQRHLVYPPVARRMGWEGKVTLSFVICRDGRVREVAVLEGSGRSLLDRCAIETVKKITDFPITESEAMIIIPVVYRLN